MLILSLITVVGELYAKKVPLPRTLPIRLGNSFSRSWRPSLRTFPVLLTRFSRFSCCITLRTCSRSNSLLGSPIHVLNTRYGCGGLKVDNFVFIIYLKHSFNVLLDACLIWAALNRWDYQCRNKILWYQKWDNNVKYRSFTIKYNNVHCCNRKLH